MTTTEKVARALAKKEHTEGLCAEWERLDAYSKENYMGLAKAALSVIRKHLRELRKSA